ncbi:MFS transporter [Glaciimonas sp. PAMC28666]|uniref:MFS transporter n=1 Tax=Glaciimonas sp. PAMC28666 TaxID=2807626 RepID=UPI001965ADB2|nr:MFS transporter [Glaciimonas sp. PAMC28666]QRX82944.1 MFS transporter [Glaciimonas sp. PAMC28666]
MKKKLKVRHLILGLMCLMYFISYIDRVNISIIAPVLKQEMGLTPTELGLVFSAFAYPYAAMQILGGWFADKYGPRLVLGILSIIWAIATILCGFSWGLWSLIMFRMLLGVGEGGAFPAATRSFTFWMPATERGFAQGITHSFSRLGGAITPPLVLLIVVQYGWRESFIILGIISLIWTCFFVWLYRNTPIEHKWITSAELTEIGVSSADAKEVSKGKTPWKEMLKRMWLVTFVDFCYGWSLWVFLTWLPSYLKDARGFDMKQLALFTALPLMAGVVGDTLGGVLSDYIYKKTGNLKLARRSLLVVGLGGALIFILPAIYTDTALTAVALLALSFFFLELTNAVLWSLPIDIAGKYAGTAGGMMNTGFGIAGMISPAVFGFLVQTTGSYEVPFLISAGLLGVAAVCSLWIDPTNKLRDEPIEEPSFNAMGNVPIFR